jgi:hypothetical protein
MTKQGALTLLLGVAIGANAVLIGLIAHPGSEQTASGETGTEKGPYMMVTGVLQGKGTSEGLYLFDTATKKLVIYFMNNNRLELLGVRDVQYDFIPQAFSPKGGSQTPTVQEMKEGVGQ